MLGLQIPTTVCKLQYPIGRINSPLLTNWLWLVAKKEWYFQTAVFQKHNKNKASA